LHDRQLGPKCCPHQGLLEEEGGCASRAEGKTASHFKNISHLGGGRNENGKSDPSVISLRRKEMVT